MRSVGGAGFRSIFLLSPSLGYACKQTAEFSQTGHSAQVPGRGPRYIAELKLLFAQPTYAEIGGAAYRMLEWAKFHV